MRVCGMGSRPGEPNLVPAVSRSGNEVGVGSDELWGASGDFDGWRLMPRISFFYGITIAMFWDESGHQTPHFHAAYSGRNASLALDGTILAGSLPPRALKLVRRWASLHQTELVANWRRARER